MYKLVIMEDQPEAARVVAAAVAASPVSDRFEVSFAGSADDLERLLSGGGRCDVLVADILLGEPSERNGIQAVRDLLGRGSATQVIYVTGYIEYCTEVYETDHVYFLTKPLRQEDFDKALLRSIGRLEEASAETLFVKSGRAMVPVPLSEVSYIESRLRKLEVHVGNDVRVTYGTLTDIAEMLPEGFLCCHKSFIVNLSHVVRLEGDDFVMDGGERVPISKRRKPEARSAFFASLGR